MKKVYLLFCGLMMVALTTSAQCPEQSPLSPGSSHGVCQNAFNIVPYLESCQTVCLSNVGAGASGQVSDLSCFGGTANDDIYLVAPNPFASLPNYDGSLAFRWVDWPGADTGTPPPSIAIHAEVEASFLGTTAQSIDCTDGFASENAFCIPSANGHQFFALANTLPTTAQLDPIVDAEAGVNVDVNDVAYFMQFVTSDGSTGDLCFEMGSYRPGFICGDATDLPLTGNASQVSASAGGCLCETPLYGGLANPKINLATACGTESESSAWYRLDLPFGCNAVTVDMTTWGGTGDYNISIVSNVDCPGSNDTNPVTGQPIFIPGDTPALPITVEASACGQSLNTACGALPAGEYYLVISGTVDRPTFAFDITVEDAASSAGTAASTFNNGQVCSGADISVSTSASVLPGAACGQTVAWFSSTNSTFNPYTGEGVYLGSGLTDVNVTLPANTTCSPQTYFIKGVVSDDGASAQASCPNASNSIIVEVYPEIGQPIISNQQCIIQVSANCPSFTVNGNLGSDTYLASFDDDGLPQSFVISNGLAGCSETFTETVTCAGNCTQPSATTSIICDPADPYNYYVEIDFSPGSANSYSIVGSDGSALLVSGAGMYMAGPFSNDNTVSLSVENTEDAACNLPLGNFVENCNPQTCPNLTSATAPLSGDVCAGEQALFQATVDQGTVNVDYTVQWYLNGTPIPQAQTMNYLHTFAAGQGCSSEFQIFSVEITCLNPDAAASTTTNMAVASGGFNVYPLPEIGIDFYPDPANCIVAPVDNCGGLDITYSPTSPQNPGEAAMAVDYEILVPGAPAGCSVIGSFQMQCLSNTCSSDIGSIIQPNDNVICAGESFSLGVTGASMDNGFVMGYAVTTDNPFNNLEGAVSSGVQNGTVIGPFAPEDTPTFTNGVEYGGDTYYFVPFNSLNMAAGTVVYTTSGTFSVSAPFNGNSATFTIPDVPFCKDATQYSMSIVIDQTQNEANLNAIDGMNSPVWSGPGGATDYYSSTVLYNDDPSGTTHTINASGNLAWGSNIDYTVTVTYNTNDVFPTLCPGCVDVSSAITYNLLPDIVLTPAPTPIVCEGASFDLALINPSANISGSYTWYDGDPAAGGTILASEEVTIGAGANSYWVEFAAEDDPSCTNALEIIINATAAPSLNQPNNPDPICAGTVVDLTAMNNTITGGQAGEVIWYRGDPSTNPFAVRLTDAIAANQAPTDGTLYTAVFTDAATGCSNQVGVTYTVIALPVLTPPIISLGVCIGESYDLASVETSLTSDTGTFEWYQGNPADGGTVLTGTVVSPTVATEYCVIFTDATSLCQNTVCMTLEVNPLPTLNNVPPQGPLCTGEMTDLADLNTLFTNDAGTFTWYEGNPNTGGTLISPTIIAPSGNTVYYVQFAQANTGCMATGFVTFFINTPPTLNSPPAITICESGSLDLTLSESDMTTQAGSFEWYDGDPAAGGTSIANPSMVTPAMNTNYYAVFTDANGCTNSANLQVTLDYGAALSDPMSPHLCAGESVDLSDLNTQMTGDAGTFQWYDNNGNALTNTLITPTVTQDYQVVFTNGNGCTSSLMVQVVSYGEITGGTAVYDCASDQIVVDLSTVSGGAGSGYMVSSSSPNQAGESLPNGSGFEIWIEDGEGCMSPVPLAGIVNCIDCMAGSASTVDNTLLCCGDTINVDIADEVLAGGHIIGYALTTAADGAVTSEADLGNALQLFPGNGDNTLQYISSCALEPGDYWLTPFISEESEAQITQLEYDTLNGCVPNGQFCPIISGTGWILDPLIIHFPDGSELNVNDDQAFGLPITPDLLDAVGGIPCLTLTDLYAGDPNGVWWFEINNVGTGDLIFSTPPFDVTVDGATCAALNGVSQVVTVDSISGIIAANSTDSIGFLLPPAVEPPLLEYDTLNGCVPDGQFCPIISGEGWVLEPLIFYFPDGSSYNVNDEQAFGLPITPELLDAVGGIPCLNLTDLFTGDPNGTWTIYANNTGTGEMVFELPAFDVTVDAATCAALNGVSQVVTIGPLDGVVPPSGDLEIDFELQGPPATGFPSINGGCEAYGTPLAFSILDPESEPCAPPVVSVEELPLVSGLRVYPNPTAGGLSVEGRLAQSADLDIEVLDLLGRTVWAERLPAAAGEFGHRLDLGGLPQGVYLLAVRAGAEVWTERIVVGQ